MSLSFYNLVKSYFESLSIIEQKQIFFILIGTLITASIAITTDAILPLLGYQRLSVYGHTTSIIFILCLVYGMLYMDIQEWRQKIRAKR